MSIWIRSVHRRPASFTAAEMVAGIGERLDLLTALYCPDDEEPAETVLARLSVDPLGPEIWVLRDTDQKHFIRIERWRAGAAHAEARELRERLSVSSGAGRATVAALLDNVSETVGFELKPTDADGMGWPLAIAAAAWLATQGDGLIHAEGDGWLEPTRKEVRPLLAESRDRGQG